LRAPLPDDGGSRSDAARIGGVGPQTVRDWVRAFNAEEPAGLVIGKAPGAALNDTHRPALLPIVESGPIKAVRGVVRWRPGAASVREIPHFDQPANAGAANCGPWACTSCRPGRVIMPSTPTPWGRSKKPYQSLGPPVLISGIWD
jgi:hypothetical protein